MKNNTGAMLIGFGVRNLLGLATPFFMTQRKATSFKLSQFLVKW